MLERSRARLAQGGFLIVVHSNADVDAIASAAGLFFTYPACSICAPGGMGRQGKALAAKLGLEIFEDKMLIPPMKVVVVDAAGPDMVDMAVPEDSVIIDHHAANEAWQKYFYVVDSTKPSCAEVILDIIRPKLTKEAAKALLYGIVADTGGFKHATPSTFRDFAELLDVSGETAEEAFAFFQDTPDDTSQRIARLKAAQRLRFINENDLLIGTSHIGAHEAEVCRMMLAMGCDVAFVGRQDDGEFRVSGRARPTAGISLAEIMSKVAEEFGGNGGGHDNASGMSGKGDVEAAMNACVARVLEASAKK